MRSEKILENTPDYFFDLPESALLFEQRGVAT